MKDGFPYLKKTADGLVVQTTLAKHATQLEALQEMVFPTLAKNALFRAPHYLNHLRIFPEGQFVVTDGYKVVGMTSTIRYHLDEKKPSTFAEVIDGGFLNTHEPDGEWLLGLDIGTHPQWRGRGIARHLYDARQQTVERLNLRGQYTYGMLSGYGALKATMRAEEYYAELIAGKRKDPTVSRQMANGFEAVKLVPGYLEDPICDNYVVLLVRKNPNFKPAC
jgi:ribosomal protein S18 acetylase RimI-like enzyme